MLISIDVEADGPCAGLYSMISLGAVAYDGKEFYAEFRPISKQYIPEALAVSGFSRSDTMKFPEPYESMEAFGKWLSQYNSVMFMSDTTSFDFSFVNYYCWRYLNKNPFGHSSMSITQIYKGFMKSNKARFHHLRETKHTHNALDDARGNMEAFKKIVDMGFQL